MCDYYTYMHETPVFNDLESDIKDKLQADIQLRRGNKVEEQDRREAEQGWQEWVESTEEPAECRDFNDAVYEQYEKGE